MTDDEQQRISEIKQRCDAAKYAIADRDLEEILSRFRENQDDCKFMLGVIEKQAARINELEANEALTIKAIELACESIDDECPHDFDRNPNHWTELAKVVLDKAKEQQ